MGEKILFEPKAGFGFSEPIKINSMMQVSSYII
jgi:hypothetical protein